MLNFISSKKNYTTAQSSEPVSSVSLQFLLLTHLQKFSLLSAHPLPNSLRFAAYAELLFVPSLNPSPFNHFKIGWQPCSLLILRLRSSPCLNSNPCNRPMSCAYAWPPPLHLLIISLGSRLDIHAYTFEIQTCCARPHHVHVYHACPHPPTSI